MSRSRPHSPTAPSSSPCTTPSADTSRAPKEQAMIPGEYILSEPPILCNAGQDATQLSVVNRGDRPIQVGSHYHFAEVNDALEFDRTAAYGRRLDIPAGTAVRFE